MYPRRAYPGYSWGMAIDLNSCIGCMACVVACQSENNIPVVGKAEAKNGRAMHWIRIDRYYEGPPEAPKTHFQPVPCMHCENAPCEVVCPVAATTHHVEGLNDMVYNRCVGTKYCSNNCPYKVRRYNFFGYAKEAISPLDPSAPVLSLMHNPDVTVRSYGVMEKCSYCVQRIRAAEIKSRTELRDIRPDEVKTACQQACPTEAIQFGRLDHTETTNVQWRGESRHYAVLNELGARPKTIYLAKIWNPEER
jgi:Fe-S-cluster-containing dehydrogenase component